MSEHKQHNVDLSLPQPPPPVYESVVTSEKAYIRMKHHRNLIELSSNSITAQSGVEGELIRTPNDFIFVIDVSSSMNSVIKDSEMEGYTRFDIVQHTLRLVLATLSVYDYFTLIVFGTDAKVVLPRVSVTPNNMLTIHEKLNAIECNGSTNLFDALTTAYKYIIQNPLSQSNEEFINRHIIILTDGAPNHPSEVEANTFSLYQKLMDDMIQKSTVVAHTLVHTFGITYGDLNDDLLSQIAHHGHGMYGFISDPTIITPCFINIIGQWFHMFVTGLTLHIDKEPTVLFIPWIPQSGSIVFKIPFDLAPSTKVVLKSNMSRPMRLIRDESPISSQQVELYEFRQTIANLLLKKKTSSSLFIVEQKVSSAISEIQTFQPKTNLSEQDHEWLTKLLYDVNLPGRIKAASVSQWGEKCLLSLGVSLRDDFVSNGYEKSFKTKSEPLLQKWIDVVEAAAKNITPPNPSIKPYKGDGGRNNSNNRHHVVSSSSYSSSSSSSSSSYFSSGSGRDYDDGCVDGNCLVDMADGSFKAVKDVSFGDLVVTDDGQIGMVRCSLLMPTNSFVELENGLRITRMHPVYCGQTKQWMFPKDMVGAKFITLDQPINMYSFLLKSKNLKNQPCSSLAMKINSYWVAHFAHNSTLPVLSHRFYGTNRIRETVERIDGYCLGRILITKALRNHIDEVYDYEGRPYSLSRL